MKDSPPKAPDSSGGGVERCDGGTARAAAAAARAAPAAAASGPGELDITALLLACASPGTQASTAAALLDDLAATDPSGEAASAALAVSDPAGLTPLLAAARRPGWAHVVRRMLGMGADPMARLLASGNTAAHLAAAAGQVDALRELLSAQPQPSDCSGGHGVSSSLANVCNTNGDTPLMFACGGDGPRQVAAVALLLQRGADPFAANREGVTAAMVAAGRGHELVLTALERHHKKRASATDNSGAKGSGSHPYCAANAQGNGPLVFAARAGQGGCVRLLLANPAVERQVFERNAAGRTPREEAQHAGHADVARLLEEFEQQATLQRDRLAAELAAESGPPAHKQRGGKQPSKQQQRQSSSGAQRQQGQQADEQQRQQQQEPEEKQAQQQQQQQTYQGEPPVPVKGGAAEGAPDEWVVVNGRKGQRPAVAAAPAVSSAPDDPRTAEQSGPSLLGAKQEGGGVTSSSSGSGSSMVIKPAVVSGGWAAIVRGNGAPAPPFTEACQQTPSNSYSQHAELTPQQPAQQHQRRPSWIDAAERALADLCPAASDLDLQPQHVLGLGLGDLSPSQLEALEAVHRGALARVADARLRLAERAMEARLAEEAARQREIAALAAAMGAR